jgi:hypothetical protein
MQRLSKTPGLLESIGIDFGSIPSHDDVFSTNTNNRLKKQRETVASHGQKRKRVQELEEELTDAHLPVRKRLCTESWLRKARGHLQASAVKIEKAAAVISKAKQTKPRKPEEVSKDQWKKCHRMVAARLFFPPRDAQKHLSWGLSRPMESLVLGACARASATRLKSE